MSNQPTSVTGGVNANYRYDGHMRRARSVVNGKVIYNVYDLSGSLVHVQKDTDNEEIDYIPGPAGTLARIQRDNGNVSTDAITYVHNDHLGSASAGTNSSGSVVWTERYTPYGEALLSPSANDDLAGYTGHIRDKELGLTYMQARYQDPVMGRFLSIDPVTFMDDGRPGMFNRYSYALNDPVNMWDPDGLSSCDIGRLIGGDDLGSGCDPSTRVQGDQDSSSGDGTAAYQPPVGPNSPPVIAGQTVAQANRSNGEKSGLNFIGLAKLGTVLGALAHSTSVNEDNDPTKTYFHYTTKEQGRQIQMTGIIAQKEGKVYVTPVPFSPEAVNNSLFGGFRSSDAGEWVVMIQAHMFDFPVEPDPAGPIYGRIHRGSVRHGKGSVRFMYVGPNPIQ